MKKAQAYKGSNNSFRYCPEKKVIFFSKRLKNPAKQKKWTDIKCRYVNKFRLCNLSPDLFSVYFSQFELP